MKGLKKTVHSTEYRPKEWKVDELGWQAELPEIGEGLTLTFEQVITFASWQPQEIHCELLSKGHPIQVVTTDILPCPQGSMWSSKFAGPLAAGQYGIRYRVLKADGWVKAVPIWNEATGETNVICAGRL